MAMIKIFNATDTDIKTAGNINTCIKMQLQKQPVKCTKKRKIIDETL